MKFYAANNENNITALAEFDTEQERQEWLDCQTDYDKLYGNKGIRKPIDDQRIINRFTNNPHAEYFPDENIPRLMWYAII